MNVVVWPQLRNWVFLKAFMNRIRTHGLSVNPKDQHKAGGLLLLTDVVTLTGLNSRLSSI